MKYKVIDRQNGKYLTTPIILFGVDKLYWWSSKKQDAHHFTSRQEAKKTLRALRKDLGAIKLEPVK